MRWSQRASPLISNQWFYRFTVCQTWPSPRLARALDLKFTMYAPHTHSLLCCRRTHTLSRQTAPGLFIIIIPALSQQKNEGDTHFRPVGCLSSVFGSNEEQITFSLNFKIQIFIWTFLTPCMCFPSSDAALWPPRHVANSYLVGSIHCRSRPEFQASFKQI